MTFAKLFLSFFVFCESYCCAFSRYNIIPLRKHIVVTTLHLSKYNHTSNSTRVSDIFNDNFGYKKTSKYIKKIEDKHLFDLPKYRLQFDEIDKPSKQLIEKINTYLKENGY